MVVHTCNRCKTEFNKKSHYDCHINRKIKCKEKVEIMIEEKIKDKQESDKADELEETHKKTQNPTDLQEIIHSIPQNLVCLDCNKTYSRIDALKRHVDNGCKVKKKKKNMITYYYKKY